MITVYAENSNKNRYVFDFIFSREYPYSFTDKNHSDNKSISIHYGVDKTAAADSDIFIASSLDYKEQTEDLRLLRDDRKGFIGKYFRKENKTLVISFDIVSVIIFFLSREEECSGKRNDYLGRFLTKNLFLHRLNLLDFPVVDELVLLLHEAIESISKEKGLQISKKSILPEGRKYVVCLTHDVDSIENIKMPRLMRYGAFLVDGLWALAKMDRVNLNYYFNYYRQIRNRDQALGFLPVTINDLVSLEKEFGFKSTFFFMARPVGLLEGGGGYDVLLPKAKEIVSYLLREGFEISLHSARRNYLSGENIAKEKKELEKSGSNEIKGMRQHYLRFSMPKSLRAYEKAGMLYDSTLGMWDDFGFRAGTCRPFYPFDIKENRRINVFEFSLNLMDGVFDDKGLSKNPEGIFNKCKEFFDTARKYRGVITLLFHPDHFTKNRNHLIAYTKILEYLSADKEALVLSSKDAYNLYKYA
jgi:peptidoglycan/xylan/chitin deacetylase (PgdA/CDA1 family)